MKKKIFKKKKLQIFFIKNTFYISLIYILAKDYINSVFWNFSSTISSYYVRDFECLDIINFIDNYSIIIRFLEFKLSFYKILYYYLK